MPKDLWINLPVKDLARSIHFYTGLGFSLNHGPGRSDQSASFKIGENEVNLLLFTEEAFAGFIRHAVADPFKGSEVLFSLGAESREEVDAMAKRVAELGGAVFSEPAEVGQVLYGCGFCDPDGHRWNMLYMHPADIPRV